MIDSYDKAIDATVRYRGVGLPPAVVRWLKRTRNWMEGGHPAETARGKRLLQAKIRGQVKSSLKWESAA